MLGCHQIDVGLVIWEWHLSSCKNRQNIWPRLKASKGKERSYCLNHVEKLEQKALMSLLCVNISFPNLMFQQIKIFINWNFHLTYNESQFLGVGYQNLYIKSNGTNGFCQESSMTRSTTVFLGQFFTGKQKRKEKA